MHLAVDLPLLSVGAQCVRRRDSVRASVADVVLFVGVYCAGLTSYWFAKGVPEVHALVAGLKNDPGAL